MTAMYDMAKLKKLAPLGAAAPAAMAAFQALDKVALAEGVIPQKYQELMAIAVALTTQCPNCREVHRKTAQAAGATHEELAGGAFVAVALRAPSRLSATPRTSSAADTGPPGPAIPQREPALEQNHEDLRL